MTMSRVRFRGGSGASANGLRSICVAWSLKVKDDYSLLARWIALSSPLSCHRKRS